MFFNKAFNATIRRLQKENQLLYIFWGPDDYSSTHTLDELKKSLGDPDMLSTNTSVLEGQSLTSDQLRLVAEALPFLAEKRLVIVRGLLERFETKRAARPKKQSDVGKQKADLLELVTCLKALPPTTVLVLLDSDVTAGNPVLKELTGKAEIKSFPLLKGAVLHRWIQERIRREGGSISEQAAELLSRLVGGNLWIMSSEVDKLVSFTGGRRIETADVEQVVSSAQQLNVFSLVDAVLELKIEVAQRSLDWLMQRGTTSSHLLVMLSRQVEMLLRAKEMASQRKSRTEIQFRLGIASDFVLHKVLEQAERFSPARLKGMYLKLLETDLAIKTGKYDSDLALTLLVADLCQR